MSKKESKENNVFLKNEDKPQSVSSSPTIKKSSSNSQYTKISVNIPNNIYELVSIAAVMKHKGRVTNYINNLICEDIKENGKTYREIQKIINR